MRDLTSVLALRAMRVPAPTRPANQDMLALVDAFLAGTLGAETASKQIIAGFPGIRP